MKRRDKNILFLLCVLAFLMIWLVRDYIFFWDTVQLGSKHAHWYYESGFQHLLLPDDIDSGHPPAFGLYLAALWKLFGKSLLVSHFAMLPFVWGILCGMLKLGIHYGGDQWGRWFPLLALADPVLATQLILISPDIILMCFFLIAWYAIVSGQNGLKAIAAIGMAMISTRGMMVVASLYLFEALRGRDFQLRKLFHLAIPYIPSGLVALAFLSYHYYVKGWIGYHAESPWASSFERASLFQFFKNILVLGWRMLDFGRVFVVLSGIGIVSLLWQKEGKKMFSKQHFDAGLLLIILSMTLSLTFLLYKGLQGHRYLLPIFVALNLFFFVLTIKSTLTERVKKGILLLAIAGFLTGNFWIYPDKVSQGWDSTLAHIPYYHLREQMLEYLDSQNIALEEVGTAFPDIGALKFRDLSGHEEGMGAKDLLKSRYILYSNIMNDFTDEEIDLLKESWNERYVLKSGGIRFVLYEKI